MNYLENGDVITEIHDQDTGKFKLKSFYVHNFTNH